MQSTKVKMQQSLSGACGGDSHFYFDGFVFCILTCMPGLIGAIYLSASPSLADERAPSESDAGTRHALIVCGLPGDAEHRALFAALAEKLHAGLTTRLAFPAEQSIVLFGDETSANDVPALQASQGPATREKLTEAVERIIGSLKPDDALWVFVIGHTHFDGRFTWLNLPGPDLNQNDFARLFAPAACREQVFFITTPASGFFIKPLAAPARTVIAATEADAEVNETIFPHKLATALADPPPMKDFDIDGDGQPTLFDAYLWTARETAQEYASGELLATEHSLIDDNGDGRGSEVQLDYLTEEPGGRLRAGRKPVPRPGDGARMRTILLPRPPEAEPEPPAAELP